MKALTLVEYNQFVYGDADQPAVGDNDVLIEVKACGICGSDVHGMDGSSGRRIPPVIMGHEAAGVIREVGAIAKERGWKPGDRVTFDSTVYCGKCESCREGRVNLCPERRVMGVSCADFRQDGAYAEFVSVPQHICYPLPDDLSFEHAAFAEPVSIALHAVNRVPTGEGVSAVVVGAGMIGMLVVQALRLRGCGPIIVVDLDERKIARAKTLGARDGVHAGDPDVLDKIRAWTGEDGADIAMEVVGIAPTLQLAVNAARKGGAVGLVGNLAAEAALPLQAVVTRELTLYGSCACAGEYPEALRCIADGSIQVEPLISAIAPLSEGSDWFSRLHKAEEDLLKVILRPE